MHKSSHKSEKGNTNMIMINLVFVMRSTKENPKSYRISYINFTNKILSGELLSIDMKFSYNAKQLQATCMNDICMFV